MDDRTTSGGEGLAIVGAVQGVAAGAYLGGAILAGVGHWAVDVYRSLATIVRGNGADEMELLERRMAVAELVVLAAIADGRVDPAEADGIRALAADEPTLAQELDAAWARYREDAALRDDGSRAARMRAAASKLTSADRDALAKLAARLPEAEPPADDSSPYRRDAREHSGALREELLSALAAER